MHPTRTGRFTVVAAMMLVLSACGGGGAANVAPIANAGAAQAVNVGATVTLNGAGSSDSDGSVASYSWTQTAGTAVTLNSASAAQPTFVAPQSTAPVTLTFRLIVTDNVGAASGASTVTVIINANAVPIANAGMARTVAAASLVSLNGTASSDADGAIASYAWTQIAGGTVVLANAASASASFAAPVGAAASTLTFQLIVTDNRGVASPPSTIAITVNPNVVPVANAGSSRTVASGSTVALNGTASSDADGSIVAWSWAQTSGNAVALSNAGTSTPGFTAPVGSVASVLTFGLIVTDNAGATSAASTVTITVNPNVAPVANAGPVQAVQAGALVTLNGSGSSDSDGTVASYSWAQTAGPAVTLNNDTSVTPGFAAPVSSTNSTLTFRLIVTDNAGAVSPAATVTITVFQNFTPLASAGPAQTVMVGAAVTLDGSSSTDFGGGSIVSFAWTQTSGPSVVLAGASTSRPTFTAPGSPSTLVFSLVVTDNLGATGGPSTVTISVTAAVTLSGNVRFQRVPFLAGEPFGLDYANPVWQPARGIIVNATLVGGSVVATAVTDSSGNYSLLVPANLTINVRAVAQMLRDATQPLPRWNMRVKDGLTPNPYSYFTGSVNTSAGTYNLDIPSGIAANGTRTTPSSSSSGPFAILDTIYAAIQTVVTATPNASFPDLYVDWGNQREGTFFTTQNGQHIALLADVTEDSDEYDQHVVAHEFGHYLEENFSRSDSIGGSHGLGDKLDMRVAFGEGFGYAFAAIVLNDPFARDSYVSAGAQVASTFNIETNPLAGAGCWCSESSVESILWDLYDNVPDGSDNIALPFSAIWDVLTGQQRTTPSATSIFSFITALKSAQPAFVGLIDPLVSAQNINSGAIDAFATNETFLPHPAMTLPLFASITRGGGPVTVRSIDDGGRYNKAGNRSFLRFTAAQSGAVVVSLTTSNIVAGRDPDFVVWNADVILSSGQPVAYGRDSSAEYPETESFNVIAGQTYIIDAYDCANGCTTAQGTPGDYDLTVTIN